MGWIELTQLADQAFGHQNHRFRCSGWIHLLPQELRLFVEASFRQRLACPSL